MNRIEMNGQIMDPLEIKVSEKGSVWISFRLKHFTHIVEGIERYLIVNCVVFGQCAQSMHTNLKKGDLVMLKGRLGSKIYTGKDGQQKERLDILVANYELPQNGYGSSLQNGFIN